jgi:FtsP/CotA-like multicopper oxidase with cupredoxin domain
MTILPAVRMLAATTMTAAGIAAINPHSDRRSTDLPIIVANQNHEPAGQFKDGVLTLALEIRRGRWFPNADEGAGLQVLGFAEAGRHPQNPGPLIRAPAGTEIRVTLSNLGTRPVVIRGLYPRPASRQDSIVVAPQARSQVQFRLDAPGTYYYRGSTTGTPIDIRPTTPNRGWTRCRK